MMVLPPNRTVFNREVTPFDGTTHYGCVSKVGGRVKPKQSLLHLDTGYVGCGEWSTFVSTHSPDVVAHYLKCQDALLEMSADEMPRDIHEMRKWVDKIAG